MMGRKRRKGGDDKKEEGVGNEEIKRNRGEKNWIEGGYG